MLYQKPMITLAIILSRTFLVRSAVLSSEYLDARNDDTVNNTRLDARDDTHPLNPGERGMLNDQNNAYAGIFWDTAYPGGNAPRGSLRDGGCVVEQYNILAEATTNAVRLSWFAGADTYMEDRSFNKFFVRNSIAPIGGRWTSSKELQNAFASIRHNMLLPSRFPIDGTGRRRRRNRVSYQCKDTEFLPPNSKGCNGAATTYTTNTNITPDGWTVVFCPKFFTGLKYLNEILGGKKLTEGDLGDARFVSYEQVILHEWLHNDVMGFEGHLTDLVDKVDDNGPKRKIYGKSEAQSYAWKFMKGDKKHINSKVASSIENYVWYYVDKMYGRQWGWTGDGNAYPKRRRGLEVRVQVDTLDLGDESTDPASLPAPSWPSNCHGNLPIDTDNTAALVCDYVKPPNDDNAPLPTSTPVVVKLPPDPKNCNCNESSCTPESPDCCASGTC